jgi:hypothetical protein
MSTSIAAFYLKPESSGRRDPVLPRALALWKNFAEALLNLGHVLATMGQTAETKNCWMQALN